VALSVVTSMPVMLGLGPAAGLATPAAVLVMAAALLLSMVICGLLNVAIERVAYRPLRRAPRLAPLISAIGVSFILINIGLHWKGASQLDFPSPLSNANVLTSVFGMQTAVQFTVKDAMVILLALPLAAGLQLFVNRTRLGLAMRATAQDRETAAMMGIDVNVTIMLAFLLGGALAGAAGMLYGVYNSSAWFFQGFRNGLYSFTAAVMGGIGNVTGALLGGLSIGIIAAFSDFLIDPRWTQAVVFGLLILVLVFRPNGLLGEVVGDRA
jgi:branched-chain amino acid transport system permease protein